MPYKTILVHLANEKSAEKILPVACHLARRDEAHLIGLFVIPPVILPPAVEVPYGADIVDAHRKAGKAEAERVKAHFDRTLANQPIVSDWRLIDAGVAPVAEVVAEQARVVDLTVLIQGGRDPAFGGNEVIERTTFDSGRPTLVVPYVGQYADVGKKILIAWNGKRESVRAVFDALPLLQKAKRVHILTIDPQNEPEPVDIPGAEIAATLARHGVNCETAETRNADIGVGNTLLNYMADKGLDMLVMGCYGHSRLREFIFGGATRHILDEMTAPVLMSH